VLISSLPSPFPCSHAPAGYFAAFTVALFVLCMPLLAAFFILRDSWLRRARGVAVVPLVHAAARRNKQRVQPLGSNREPEQSRSQDGGAASIVKPSAVIDSSGPAPDPIVVPFVSNYAPWAWAFPILDATSVVVVGVLEGILPRPASLSEQVCMHACTALDAEFGSCTEN
jgi:hypothetical protein